MPASRSQRPSKNASFAHLAPEVLTDIFTQATPEDVLALRKCSRKLHNVSCQRQVWIGLLHRACSIHFMFTPTFLFKTMTLSQLEHATTAPSCFLRILKRAATVGDPNNKRVPLVACTTRIIRHPDLLQDSNIFLVPGGRFLLISSTTGVMSLVDLGHDLHAVAKPVASIQLDNAISTFEVQATTDGLGIRICTVISLDTSTLVRVLEVFPSSPSPSFLQVAMFSVPHQVLSYSFNKDLFAYADDSHIGVHDFIADMVVVWCVPEDMNNKIILMDDGVLLLQIYCLHRELSVWRIPPLQPAQMNPENLMCEDKILLMRSPNQWCCITNQLAWFKSYPDHPKHVDLLGIANNGSHGIAHYKLLQYNSGGDSDLPPFLPCLSQMFLAHENWPTPSWVGINSTRLWDKLVLLLWTEDHTLIANLSELPPGSAIPEGPESPIPNWKWAASESVSAILYDAIEQPRPGAITHCPMSARLCVIESNAIRVLDYLVPPP